MRILIYVIYVLCLIVSTVSLEIQKRTILAELAALERARNGEPQHLEFVFIFRLHLIRLETS